MDIKPIRTKADHKAALSEVESLWDAEAGTPEGDKLEVLATLVDSYEREHCPILPPDPIEAIKFRLDQEGKTRKALESIIGTRARVSEVLNGSRRLTLAMIRSLHRELHIPLEVLVAETSAGAPRSRDGRRGARRARASPARRLRSPGPAPK